MMAGDLQSSRRLILFFFAVVVLSPLESLLQSFQPQRQ